MTQIIFLILLIVAIVTGFIGYIEHQRLTEISTLILCQSILAVCVEIRVAKTKSDKVLGSAARALEEDPDLRSHVRTFITRSSEVRKLGSRFMKACHERYLRDLEATVEGMAAGVLKLDLGPGGRFYSQADAIEMCRRSYRGTSLVNPEEYWHSRTGRESLSKNRQCAASGKEVMRIFIEQRSRLSELRQFVKEHTEAGVICFVAIEEDIDKSLRRDFALLDGEEVAVELHLNRDRAPTLANFYVAERDNSRREIEELTRVWDALMEASKTADEFLRETAVAVPVQGSKTI
jgi:hypothetical protein